MNDYDIDLLTGNLVLEWAYKGDASLVSRMILVGNSVENNAACLGALNDASETERLALLLASLFGVEEGLRRLNTLSDLLEREPESAFEDYLGGIPWPNDTVVELESVMPDGATQSHYLRIETPGGTLYEAFCVMFVASSDEGLEHAKQEIARREIARLIREGSAE